ncbi:hypothetical protein PRVXH_002170 [Proteinivorax hydrogeniformans]|uniref:Transporter n=1 Tax=Proteinivorax hydrogeniformans TaxID=1826727 RepID=A0AAU8HRN1_9FIRM
MKQLKELGEVNKLPRSLVLSVIIFSWAVMHYFDKADHITNFADFEVRIYTIFVVIAGVWMLIASIKYKKVLSIVAFIVLLVTSQIIPRLALGHKSTLAMWVSIFLGVVLYCAYFYYLCIKHKEG